MHRVTAYLLTSWALAPGAGLASQALTLESCARTTHVTHAGEEAHADLGAGRVMWQTWWSHEGTARDVVIMECASGATLKLRTAEENMSDTLPFDRTDHALSRIAALEAGDRIFATFERIITDVGTSARSVMETQEISESCACAARYPALRADKAAFVMTEIKGLGGRGDE